MIPTRGWHRVAIEWSDGIATTGHRLEFVTPEDTDVFVDIAGTLAMVVERAGLSQIMVGAHILADLDTPQGDPCAEALAEAAERFLRRRRGGVKR